MIVHILNAHVRNVRMLAAAALVAAPLSAADAAPQALGLVATDAPVPLKCFAGDCAAEFSSFCLQQARDLPELRTPYRAVGEAFTLIAIAEDGRSRRLPAAEHVTIESARSFTAVRISMPQRALAALGAARAAIEVGPRVSLVPVPVVGDPDPQTEMELAAAAGPLRAAGSRLVDEAGPEAGAARLTNRAINAFPERGYVAPEDGDAIWRETVGESDAGPAARRRADDVYAYCRRQMDEGWVFSLRRCLERMHDDVMRGLNVEYWKAVAGT